MVSWFLVSPNPINSSYCISDNLDMPLTSTKPALPNEVARTILHIAEQGFDEEQNFDFFLAKKEILMMNRLCNYCGIKLFKKDMVTKRS